MRFVDLIEKKADGFSLSKEEIEFLWERFIFILAEAQNIDFDQKIIRNLMGFIWDI